MKKILLSVSIVLCFSSVAFSQLSLNIKGWEIPDISIFELKSETKEAIDGFWIKVAEFDLGNVDKKPAIFLRSKKDAENKSDMFCEVRKAKRFSVGDKIFAYTFQCDLLSITETNRENITLRSKSYLGAMTEFFYYDEDGDGIFKHRVNIWQKKFKIIGLPDWTKIQN